MKKRRIAVLSLIIGCVAILASGSIAYFTAEGSTQLNYKAGKLEIKIIQDTTGADRSGRPGQIEFSEIMPGTQRSNSIRVQNISSQAAYVRVMVQKQIQLAPGVLGEPDETLINLNINHQDWFEKDGYYYFRKPLTPGQLTEPLFTTVNFSPMMNDLYQASKISIKVSADAVQVENNGQDVEKAAGWP